jgi:hypothetical protein
MFTGFLFVFSLSSPCWLLVIVNAQHVDMKLKWLSPEILDPLRNEKPYLVVYQETTCKISAIHNHSTSHYPLRGLEF